MRLNYLNTFCAFVENEYNMNKTAEVLGTSHLMVKKNLRNLENQLKRKLFYSKNLKLIPTEEGMRFYKELKPQLNLLNSIIDTVRSDENTLKIATTQAFTSCWLPIFLNNLMKEYPKISIDSLDKPEDLTQKNCDIFLGTKTDLPKKGSLHEKHLCDFHIMMFGNKKYLDSMGLPVSLEDLREHKIIGYSHVPDYFTSDNPNYHLRLLEPIKTSLTFCNSYNMLQAIEMGLGIGPISKESAMSSNEVLLPILPEIFKPQKIEVFAFSRFDFVKDERISDVFDKIKNNMKGYLSDLQKKYETLTKT